VKFQKLLVDPRTLFFLSRGLYVVGGIVAVAILWWGGKALLLHRQATEFNQMAKQHEAELADANRTILDARNMEANGGPTGLEAVSAFQSALQSTAKEMGCRVSEFASTTDLLPFITQFSTDLTYDGWGQVEVKLSLEGSAMSVMNTLNAIADIEIPFEFSGIDFTRTNIDRSGLATVTAHIELRVLTRGEQG
jgi:hypothetical protein